MTVYTVVKTIGTASRQYSTLQAWEDAAPADLTTAEKSACTTFATAAFVVGETLNFVGSGAVGKLLETDSTGVGTGTYMVYGITSGDPATGDVITGASSTATCTLTSGTTPDIGIIWQGRAYNDSAFTGTSTVLTITGSTSSTTCYKELTTATGQSFIDHATVTTNPLFFDATKGVSITHSGVYTGASVAVNEQYARFNKIQARGTGTGNGAAAAIDIVAIGTIVDKCIFSSSAQTIYNATVNIANGILSNSLVLLRNSTAPTNIIKAGASGTSYMYNVTAVSVDAVAPYGYRGNYNTHIHKNCAYFNVTLPLYVGAGQGTATSTTCYTSGTATTGFTNVAFGSAGFVNTASDFRLAAGSPLIDTGTTDATNVPKDIIGKTRAFGGTNTAYDVGCWEYAPYQTITSTIGTASRQYSTLQAWEDAAPVSLVLENVIWQGQAYNDTEFYSTVGTILSLTGSTSSSTCYKELTTGPGQSFRDHANVTTNPLRYDQTKGVGIRVSVWNNPTILCYEPNVRISNLQVRAVSGSGSSALSIWSYGILATNCIFEAAIYNAIRSDNSGEFRNCVMTAESAINVVVINRTANLYNCTVVSLSGSVEVINGSYGTATYKNCAFFSATPATNLTAGNNTYVFTTCISNATTLPTGVTSSSLAGANFVAVGSTCATTDLRINAGSTLIDKATTDATNVPKDIIGKTRAFGGTNTAYDVGCWEYAPYQTIVKTIGSTGDYSTLQAWEDAASASLVLENVIWQGQCQKQLFNVGSSVAILFSGSTSSATCYKHLTTAPGASFRDNPNIQNTPLRYDAANGAAIYSTYNYYATVDLRETYVRVSNLQVQTTTNVALDAATLAAAGGSSIENCIFESGGSVPTIRMYGASQYISNCLIIARGTASGSQGIFSVGNGAKVYNCTVVGSGTSPKPLGISFYYAIGLLKNSACFNVTTAISGTPTPTVTNSYTDAASPPSGFVVVPYDTEKGSGFYNITDANRDYRIKASSALVNAGVADTTYSLYDIAGTKRPQDLAQKLAEAGGGRYDVGCWEYVYPVNTGKAIFQGRSTDGLARIPWNSQPQTTAGINWANSLTKDLILLVQPKDSINLVNGEAGVLVGTSPSIGFTKSGIARKFASAGYRYSKQNSPGASDPFSVLILQQMDGTAASTISLQASLSINLDFALYAPVNSSRYFAYDTNAAGTQALSINNQLVDNVVQSLVYTRDSVNDRGYIDGVNSGTTAITGAWSSGLPIDIGRGQGGAEFSQNSIILVAVWRKTLSSVEIKRLYENPWQLFKPREQRVWAPAPPSGKWTLNRSNLIGTNKNKVPKVAPNSGDRNFQYTSQPQVLADINRANPITKGLCVGIDSVRAGYFGNVNFKIPQYPPTSSGFLSPIATPLGIARQFYGISGGATKQVFPEGTSTASITMLQIGLISSNTGAQMRPFTLSHTGNSDTFAIFQADGTTAGRIRGYVYVGGPNYCGGSVTLPVGSTYIAILRHTYGVGQALWLNGIKDSVTTSATGATLSNTWYGTYVSPTDLGILNAVWNRALNDAEIASLSANPWQIFAPPVRRIWTPAQ